MTRGKGEAAREAGVSAGVIDGLIDEGTLQTVVLPPEPVAENPDPDFAQPEFSSDQRAAADALKATIKKGGYSVTLLDGVTGSGKTEVYFEAVADAIRAGKTKPDPDAGDRAHRAVSRSLRRALRRAARGMAFRDSRRANARAPGPRSPRARCRSWSARARLCSCLMPISGLIIVDEEHDPAYKQEDGVHYHARDMAVVRGHIAKIPIVLSSATPSVETEANARRGRYARVALPERFGGQRLPSVEPIDLRAAPPPRGRFISPMLAGEVKTALERKEQALLFLNRRGYAPLTLCRACGFRFACPNCDAWLVDHRFKKQLVCHHCGFGMPHPHQCPKCAAADSFVACGPGVERLEEEVHELFPDARVLVLSSDLVASVERMREEFAEIAQGLYDIVIGTQLVAKGHNFPMLNLVGVVDADLGLSNGDPRAAERTFQLLHQVVGRAGRDTGIGRGFLQTHQPDHPVMRALIAQDREAFYDAEIELREKTHYPPFGRLASIVVSGGDKHETASYARELARWAPLNENMKEGVRVLGPAEAPLALIRGRHRMRLLLKAPRNYDLSAYLRRWLAKAPKRRGSIKLDIDIDPQSFL